MSLATVRQLRYRWSPYQLFAELMAKRWMEGIVPVTLLLLVMLGGVLWIDGFASPRILGLALTDFGELGLIAIGLSIVIMAGGIDLSVGSMFGLANILLLIMVQAYGWPVPLALLATLLLGAGLGAINGLSVAVFKAPPFLVTLVTLIVFRGVTLLLVDARLSDILVGGLPPSLTWLWLREGRIAGLPLSVVVLLVVAIAGQVVLSRMSVGWRLLAIGANRKAARHAGMRVGQVVFSTYVLSGVLTALSACFYAARLASPEAQTGAGLEIAALTAAVIGGISLSGGVGTTIRVVIGTATVAFIGIGLLLLNVAGQLSNATTAAVLVLAIGIDAKWSKNRGKAIEKSYLNPTYVDLGPLPDVGAGSGSRFAQDNNLLQQAEPIGLGSVEGPEDVILDEQGRLYCGDRRGWIHRFSGEGLRDHEIFARIGGHPLGHAWDSRGNLLVCSAGMGVYGVEPSGKVFKVTDETRRSPFRLKDDSSIGIADDLDVAPDGRIFFSDPTTRFDLTTAWNDVYEGRPNGRVLCHDPATGTTTTVKKGLVFPNGICVTHDGQAILIASTWMCEIYRYWISGPREGEFEIFAEGFPGYLDNINRASDGGYWLAINGMRSPAFDLAMRMPGFRRQMIKTLPFDEWLFPSMNNGCIVKLSSAGEVERTYWDLKAENHATTTSMREHDGQLYIGGLENNRVGRITIPEGHLGEACGCGQWPCALRSPQPAATRPEIDQHRSA
jgi:ribose transport system permease protein